MHRQGISFSEGSATFLERRFGSRILSSTSHTFGALQKPAGRLLPRLGLEKSKPPNHTSIRTITLGQLMEKVGEAPDLLKMDVQGLEFQILRGAVGTLRTGSVKTFLVGSHGREVHEKCLHILRQFSYHIEFDEAKPKNQPDGIIVARCSRAGSGSEVLT